MEADVTGKTIKSGKGGPYLSVGLVISILGATAAIVGSIVIGTTSIVGQFNATQQIAREALSFARNADVSLVALRVESKTIGEKLGVVAEAVAHINGTYASQTRRIDQLEAAQVRLWEETRKLWEAVRSK